MLIATKITLSSPFGRRPAVHTTFCRTPDDVVTWAADKVRRFALRCGIPVLAVDHDVTTKVYSVATVAQALRLDHVAHLRLPLGVAA